MNITPRQPLMLGAGLASSPLTFPRQTGNSLAQSLELPGFRQKRLLFNRLEQPGRVHVYSAECHAGERLRVQMLVPMLPLGGAAVPAFAVVAHGLPYSADVHKLPLDLPAGYSAVVAPPPSELLTPLRDRWTRACYYPGPMIDTHTLVGGRCYIVVWSPYHHMGKYILQLGHVWLLNWTHWAQLPLIWWQVRGWFGLSRAAAYWGGAGMAAMAALLAARYRGRKTKIEI